MSASIAGAKGASLVVDHVDVSHYAKEGLIRLFVDVLDADNKPIPRQGKEDLRFYVNNQPLGARVKSVKLTSFKDSGLPLAVGVLTTNYGGFVPKAVGEPSLWRFAQTGSMSLIKGLRSGTDWYAMWLYNEGGSRQVVSFTRDLKQALQTVKTLPHEHVVSAEKARIPNFYRHLDQAVKTMAAADNLPRRRVLLVVSDGIGEFMQSQKSRLETALQRTIDAANDGGVRIHAVGAMLQDDVFLPYLARAARRTFGVYIQPKEVEDMEPPVAKLPATLFGQYVVDVVAPGLAAGKPLRFRVDAITSGGEKVSGAYPRSLKLPAGATR